MYDNLPEWLKEPPIFCVCNEEKKPKYPTKPNDLDTFFPFDEAIKAIGKGERLGIGIWGALCGIDIDKCIVDGVISDDAKTIIDLFPEAYIEYSPSHTGLHLLFLSKEQHKDKDIYYTKPTQKYLKSIGLTGMKGLEFYQGMTDHRYFTVTGDVYQQQDTKVGVDGTRILDFLNTYMKKPIPTVPHTDVEYTEDDEEDKAWFKFSHIIYKNSDFLNIFPSVQSLFDSFYSTDHTGDESSEDFKLMSKLAFWCNNNPRVMQGAFELSEWYKTKDAKHLEKWDSRQDYRNDYCIKPAIAGTHNVAKVMFKDWFYYDAETKSMNIDGFKQSKKGGGIMKVYPIEGKEDRFTYKNDSNIRYTAQLKMSSTGKVYCSWIKGYNCDTKEDLGFINRDNKDYYKIQGHFLKHYTD